MLKKTNLNLSHLVYLLNKSGYHNGISLGRDLGISRAAVCKLIQKLKDYDIQIDSVKKKGYALLEPLILLDRIKIQEYLMTTDITIDLFERLSSTNDYLKLLDHSGNPRICLAEQQTHGRGRLARRWHSPFAQNIYFSCIYYFEKDISELAGLSLIVSLAVVTMLKHFQLSDVQIKWPNDVFYNGQKLSGSLIEIEAETHGICRAIIGIGININMLNDQGGNISQEWTSMRIITKQYMDRNKICALLIDTLFAYLKKFSTHGLSIFQHEWQSVDLLFNKIVNLKNGTQDYTGRVTGINHLGNLLLEIRHGTIKAFSSGDTSIVKPGLY
ncbi:MAG: biotin--[acetyl-CoA-carboxylase] ligase [Gammaproteobacteria bacterium RIFCSPHIGHO2_12_FULL_37_14]|nr:MAG: biotin--[acetyl-CoA-carboxylase] ligase [Gammaproteobacteria bacterium RIFCSPHIGHO2_12_FULL_37_14]